MSRAVASNLLTVLSLLLFGAVLALWVLSYAARPTPHEVNVFPLHGHRLQLISHQGQFRFEYWRREPRLRLKLAEEHERLGEELRRLREQRRAYGRDLPHPSPDDHSPDAGAVRKIDWQLREIDDRLRETRTGLEAWRNRTRRPRAQVGPMSLAVPAALSIAAALPGCVAAAMRWRRRRLQRLRAENRCVQCGYDLRATRERCPECGRLAASARTGVLNSEASETFENIPPSPGTRGEGGGEGSADCGLQKTPHPDPLPEYREREKKRHPYPDEMSV